MSSSVAPPVLGVAQQLADDVLFPTAQVVDRSLLIDVERFATLAEAGLFGIVGPPDLGFGGLDVHGLRRTMAAISSGCGATFFAWAQHHGVVRTISGASNDELRATWLARLCRGDAIAGTAFAHLRRADRRAVTATRVEGGWRLDGFAPWATSWGIAEVFTVAAESESGELVWVLMDGVDQPGIDAVPLSLPVFGATGTVALRFDGLTVPDDRVLGTEDATAWRAADRVRAAAGQTGVLGVAERAIRLLGEEVRGRHDAAVGASERLRSELDQTWVDDRAVVDALSSATLDGADGEALLARASDHRAACLDLGRRATTALLAAGGGGAMDLRNPAQRLAREAAFYVIQAQTADGRAATLRSV